LASRDRQEPRPPGSGRREPLPGGRGSPHQPEARASGGTTVPIVTIRITRGGTTPGRRPRSSRGRRTCS